MFFLARLQDYRFQPSWRISFYPVPAIVVSEQARLHTEPLYGASRNIVHERLQECLFPSDRPERERFEPSARALPSVFRAIEVDEKTASAYTKTSGSRARE